MKRYEIYWGYGQDPGEFEEPDGPWVRYEDAQAAIQAAVLAEREACAFLAEVQAEKVNSRWIAEEIADAINARSQK